MTAYATSEYAEGGSVSGRHSFLPLPLRLSIANGLLNWEHAHTSFSVLTVTLFPAMAINDIVKQLDEQIRQLQQARRFLTGDSHHSAQTSTRDGRRGPVSMSQEARDRIAAAQGARWARQKDGKSTTASAQSSANNSSAPGSRKGPRRLSAAARARIAAAQKARWARVKAQKKK